MFFIILKQLIELIFVIELLFVIESLFDLFTVTVT